MTSEAGDAFGQPVGVPVDDRAARRPGAVVLEGRFGRIEPLQPEHAATLWPAVRNNDRLWTYMAYGPFADQAAFSAWIDSRIGLDDPVTYAITDPAGQAQGLASLMAIRPDQRVIEVGHILYAPALQRTPLGTEAGALLAAYVFETLGYRRYEWKCDALNAASRQAAERYGFGFEGIFRQHMIIKRRNRDTAWYAMLDGDWPAHKTALAQWLAPDNFTADGGQRRSLAACRASGR